MGYTVIKDGKRSCLECRQDKPLEAFYRSRYTTRQGKPSTRHASTCKACASVARKARHALERGSDLERQRVYRAANRNRLRASLNAYRAENMDKLRRQRVVSEQKRRVRGYNRCTKSVRAVIDAALELARVGDGYLDAYTGQIIDRPTIDHVVPLSEGGEHTLENVCITALEHNRAKRAMPMLVYLAKSRSLAA